MIETLEPRVLLSTAIKINFQPANAPAPDGYFVDSGGMYGNHGDYQYGWTNELQAKAVGGEADICYRTYIRPKYKRRVSPRWEISLAPGLYNVHVVAGDPGLEGGSANSNGVRIEGTTFLSGTVSPSNRWLEKTGTVVVKDGALTLDALTDTTCICLIEIEDATPSNVTATPRENVPVIDLSWQDRASIEESYVVERSSDGTNFSPLVTLPPNSTSCIDLDVEAGATYHYRIKAHTAALDSWSSVVIATATSFRVFDTTQFINKPDLSSYGVDNTLLVTANGVWANWPSDLSAPDEATTRAFARRIAETGQIVCFDIEHWPLDIRNNAPEVVNANLVKLINIVTWIHEETPQVKVGFYGISPIRDHWTPSSYYTALDIPSTSPYYTWYKAHLADFEGAFLEWQRANDILKPLMDKVDVVFPSLYAFYDNPAGWDKYAYGMIMEAKRLAPGKPVYPFIWMQFHASVDPNVSYVSGPFWEVQLDACRQYADGMVIWGSYQRTTDGKWVTAVWNEEAGWWVETEEFLLA
jgi:hypothetical protein